MTTTEVRPGTVQVELEMPVRIIRPRLWAGIFALVVALVGVGSWAAFGELPQQVTAPAVLTNGAGPVPVRSPGAGSVVEMKVTVGQHVSLDQPVAVLASDGRRNITSPADGTVIAVQAPPGTAVLAGSSIIALDPTGQPPRAFLPISDRSQLARLSPGRQVVLAAGGQRLLGTISSIPSIPTTKDAVTTAMVIDLPGVPTGPLWLVPVALDAGQTLATPMVGTAVVVLPSHHPLTLLFGE